MKELTAKLEQLQDVEHRRKTALIAELIPTILIVHDQGYSIAKIHEAINEKVPVSFTSFKTTYYRLKKAIAEKEQQGKAEQVPSQQGDDSES